MAQNDGFTESVFLSAGFDGSNPIGGVVLAADGNFYGAATNGGAEDDGVVYKVTPSGTVSTVYAFCVQSRCADGQFPSSGLIQGADGNFYGTTLNGGANGGGVAFKVTPSGTYTVLYAFCSVYTTVCTDGKNPGQLVQGTDGNFYGTAGGGTNTYGNGNQGGVVFQLTPSGKLTVLHSFCSQKNCSDGGLPSSGLVQASDGNFYGLAASGGANGGGVAYRISASGSFSIVYSFCYTAGTPCADGTAPNGTLVEANDGSFYGVTQLGGVNAATGAGGGTAFNLTTGGTLSTLYSFCSQANCTDGYAPASGLYLATDGNYYGTTIYGHQSNPQPNQDAVVFQLSGSTVTTVYTFCTAEACEDGEGPNGGLIQGTDGAFYSVTEFGGAYSSGTVYKLTHGPALAGPVHLSLGESTISLGGSTTLAWSVAGAYSQTLQQCYAFVQNGATAAGSWSGKNPGGGVSNGSVTLKPTAAGTYTYALTCGGVESGFATLTVEPTPSTTTLAQSPTPISVGQNLTLKATVAGPGGTPTGTVTFNYGSIALATVALSSGVASLTVPTYALPAGSYGITAAYSGDSNFSTSTSSVATVLLNKAATATSLLASPNPVTPPANVTFTATVKRSTAGALGTPAGSVGFYLGPSLLTTANLNSSGVATFTVSTNGIPASTYAITAKYNGDGSDDGSTSSAASVVVK
jgi:uncharacterized repeat protein (TIGR03803 family)